VEEHKFSHMALFDGSAIADLALRSMLGAAGLSKDKIDELAASFHTSEAARIKIVEIMASSDVRSDKFARTLGGYLRASCTQFLLFAGFSEEAVKTNVNYILGAAKQPHQMMRFGSMDDPDA
jgi:uncharacterized protein YaaQ